MHCPRLSVTHIALLIALATSCDRATAATESLVILPNAVELSSNAAQQRVLAERWSGQRGIGEASDVTWATDDPAVADHIAETLSGGERRRLELTRAVLQEAVQDYEFNITRFAIIGGTTQPDANKTTIVFALPSTPGALFKALSVFALRDINLSKLESRPFRGRPWEYLFYVEVDAKSDDVACARALTHLGEFATWMRVLGTYKGWVRTPPAARA